VRDQFQAVRDQLGERDQLQANAQCKKYTGATSYRGATILSPCATRSSGHTKTRLNAKPPSKFSQIVKVCLIYMFGDGVGIEKKDHSYEFHARG